MTKQQQQKAMQGMRRGLPVALAMSISDALDLISQGRIEHARNELEGALLYADAKSEQVADLVGIDAVRPGEGGFKKLGAA